MSVFAPRLVKSTKSRFDTKSNHEQFEDVHTIKKDASEFQSVSKVQSHFLVPSEKLDKVTRRVIAPYAQIERKGLKDEEAKEGRYLDMNRFNVFLEDTVDLDSLLYETAVVLKTITDSSGVFLYIVNPVKEEIVLMPHNTKMPERHEVNIPIGEGKIAAAHAAATKEFLLIEDVQRDRRFSEGLKWVDAKVALCMPIVKPDGNCYGVLELYRTHARPYDDHVATKELPLIEDVQRDRRFSEGLKWVDAKVALCMPIVKPDGNCYGVLELYRTHARPYDDNVVYTAVSVACWAGAAVHQAQARITLQKTAHLNNELRALLHSYFCDLASIDTMLTDMLVVVKSFIGAMRSSFYILDRDNVSGLLLADMWDDGWPTEKTPMPKKKTKVNLSQEQTPAGLVARTGQTLNIHDAYKDPRFFKEIDPITGTVVRSCLVSPIKDKTGVIGVVQLTNKNNVLPFTPEDETIFEVFVNYCSLIVHFYNMQHKKSFHWNLNKVYDELMSIHLKPCRNVIEELMETNGIVLPPSNFKTYDYHISEGNKEDMPGLVAFMYMETFADRNFDRAMIANFCVTVLDCYRNNPYHNAEHAFCFTHTLYLVLTSNPGNFDYVETAALMLSGLCHDIDHPGYNNNFLALCKHPLAQMYKSSILENHHFFLAKKIIEDKNILGKLPVADRERILEEIRYDILCTDLAVYFQIRAQLTPLVGDHSFDWTDSSHRKMLKGILMTTSDLSGCCKPFGVAKAIAESVYEEFYNQGDKERALGYTPLSMMDRRRSINQPAEQIQFLSVVVLPCVLLLQTVFPNTTPLTDNCRKTQDAWREEIEIRGQRLWRQEDSLFGNMSSRQRCQSRSDVLN